MPAPTRDKGPFLREWRHFRGLTLTELAARVGMSQGTLSRYETGARRITTETLQKLADELAPSRQIGDLFVEPPAWGVSLKAITRAKRAMEQDIETRLERLGREDVVSASLLQIWRELNPRQRRLLIEIAKAIWSLE
jgi:transcriptional regulator with XRE-family HTH domain